MERTWGRQAGREDGQGFGSWSSRPAPRAASAIVLRPAAAARRGPRVPAPSPHHPPPGTLPAGGAGQPSSRRRPHQHQAGQHATPCCRTAAELLPPLLHAAACWFALLMPQLHPCLKGSAHLIEPAAGSTATGSSAIRRQQQRQGRGGDGWSPTAAAGGLLGAAEPPLRSGLAAQAAAPAAGPSACAGRPGRTCCGGRPLGPAWRAAAAHPAYLQSWCAMVHPLPPSAAAKSRDGWPGRWELAASCGAAWR